MTVKAEERALKQHLLGLLADGPCSFAALYGGLVRHCGYSARLDADVVLRALREMEAVDWVVAWQMLDDGTYRHPTEEDRERARSAYLAWLPSADLADLSVDEIGLWYDIQAEGRHQWNQEVSDDAASRRPRWTLDDMTDSQTISVEAENIAAAENALRTWLSLNPQIELLEPTRSVEPLPMFVTRDGATVLNGVKLVCGYALRQGRP